MNASAPPPRGEPEAPRGNRRASNPSPSILALRTRLAELEAAILAEGIDPAGPLGVWSRAQRDAIMALLAIAEELDSRIIERVEAIEAGMMAGVALMDAEVARLKAETAAAWQLMLTVREQAAYSKEERLKAGDDMAIRLSDKIQDCLKTTMLVRERRWNLKQNVRLVSLGVAVLFAVFLSGQWMQGNNRAAAIIGRCQTNLVVDSATKVSYCAMSTIEGVPDAAPSEAAAR